MRRMKIERRGGRWTETWRREVGAREVEKWGELETRRKRGAGRWTDWARERGGVMRGGAGHAEKGGGGTVGSPRDEALGEDGEAGTVWHGKTWQRGAAWAWEMGMGTGMETKWRGSHGILRGVETEKHLGRCVEGSQDNFHDQ